MNYNYRLIVTDEDEQKIFDMGTSSLEDFEESIMRKADHAIERYEGERQAAADNEYERQGEE